ncbi:unnamed protein product [Symbiodinium sp. CCMP2592]|nr:unnamed protein product [Symbiodinium sp. CCMP2592]
MPNAMALVGAVPGAASLPTEEPLHARSAASGPILSTGWRAKAQAEQSQVVGCVVATLGLAASRRRTVPPPRAFIIHVYCFRTLLVLSWVDMAEQDMQTPWLQISRVFDFKAQLEATE